MKALLSNLSSSSKRIIVSVILLSFLVGSISGAIFGVLAATLLSKKLSSLPVFTNTVVPTPLSGEKGPVAEVVRRSAPSVVSIVVTKDVPRIQQSPFRFDPFGNFFDDFFSAPAPSPAPETERQRVGGGTGFFISADGLLVTNKHVVADEQAEYTVFTNDGKQYNAKVLARDSVTDLAVVKVEGTNFPTVPFGDSSTLELGESVVAIGNALGEFSNTVSTGVVSGLSRSIVAGGSLLGSEQLTGVIQTDAAINPGNSGGPLLNLAGQVVGINTAIATGAQNIGFAIPINDVKQVIESVKKDGRIVRPFLGVRYVILDEELAKEKNLPVDYGALVVRGDTATDLAVTPGSPADKVGIVENDIILEIGGKKITQDQPLSSAIAGFKVGDTVELKVLHRGTEKTVRATLTERK